MARIREPTRAGNIIALWLMVLYGFFFGLAVGWLIWAT